MTEDGEPVQSSSRVLITPDIRLEDVTGLDMLFVVGGLWLTNEACPGLQKAIRQFARRGVRLGALSSGVFLLARAGLLIFIVGYGMVLAKPPKVEKRWRGQSLEQSGDSLWNRLRRRIRPR